MLLRGNVVMPIDIPIAVPIAIRLLDSSVAPFIIIHSVERGSQAGIPNPLFLLNLLFSQTPLEDQRAHPQAFTRLGQRNGNLLNIGIAKELSPASSNPICRCEHLGQHLVEDLEVSLGHSELVVELGDHLLGEFLPIAIAFS